MRVTKAWFLDAIAHMPDDLEIDLHWRAYDDIRKAAGVKDEPEAP